jgi:polysaccharide deacetylase family protein (PEP-CTERM system associated)
MMPMNAHGPHAAASEAVLSFDVEEHFRIEAAAGLPIDAPLKDHYGGRLESATHWLLEQLDRFGIKATFFVIGEVAASRPALIRAIQAAGHEVASHGWDHRRVHQLTPAAFRADVWRSKDGLEQVTQERVAGYRAPTFSIVRETAWALDVLAELGLAYDSSIFPVRHDRYGVPQAPRTPFVAQGVRHTILELPPATWRLLGVNLPAGGGGYFRLFPLFFLDRAIAQLQNNGRPSLPVLYFHPWEFDPGQARLPLNPVSRFRTYAGLFRSRVRLTALFTRHRFTRAIDLVKRLDRQIDLLPRFPLHAPGG